MPSSTQVQQQHHQILATTDQDSLMALEALMKIKSDNCVEKNNNVPPPRATTTAMTPVLVHQSRVSPDTPPLTALPSPAQLVPTTTSAAGGHPAITNVTAVHLSPAQHMRRTVALPVPVPSASFTSWVQQQQQQQRPIFPAAIPTPVPIVPATTTTTTTSPTRRSAQQLLVRSTPPKKRKGAAAAMQKKTTKTKSSWTDTKAAAAIRRDKIEAALRSKPQRGKKRENLSVLERMELTRTRNREHAKTTRERKKARYQELLQCEQELNAYKKQEVLLQQRTEALNQFLSSRVRLQRRVPGKNNKVSSSSILQFEATTTTVNGSNNKQNLEEFDAYLVSSFVSDSTPCTPQFHVQDLAISPSSGVGFAKVILIQTTTQEQLMKAVIHFRFESDCLVSMEFVVMETAVVASSSNQDTPTTNEKNKFGYQSFPSVVSLDANGTTTTPATATTEDGGPGMHI